MVLKSDISDDNGRGEFCVLMGKWRGERETRF